MDSTYYLYDYYEYHPNFQVFLLIKMAVSIYIYVDSLNFIAGLPSIAML